MISLPKSQVEDKENGKASSQESQNEMRDVDSLWQHIVSIQEAFVSTLSMIVCIYSPK
jgi:hypothetical protein